jgi:gamma-glutamylcyclotransferase (GGCT)/AIG2-like uncharacterized protein YtfP
MSSDRSAALSSSTAESIESDNLNIDLYGAESGYAEHLHECPHAATAIQRTPFKYDFALNFSNNSCGECKNDKENWVCLSCYHLGCGRFKNGHAQQHYDVTKHALVVGLDDLSFWCFGCDNYISHLYVPNIYLIYAELHMLKFKVPTPEQPRYQQAKDIALEVDTKTEQHNNIDINNNNSLHNNTTGSNPSNNDAIRSPNPSSPILSDRIAPPDSEIQYLAVYGTLRDDDNSGAAWTKEFVKDLERAQSGRVVTEFGIEMYWSRKLNYPFALLLPPNQISNNTNINNNIDNKNNNDSNHNNNDKDSSKHSGGNLVLNASSTIIPSISVRVLSWSSPSQFAQKLAAADSIEGYNPVDEGRSEYVRRKVRVKLSGGEEVWCFIYVALTSKPLEEWERIKHGDWLNRHDKD